MDSLSVTAEPGIHRQLDARVERETPTLAVRSGGLESTRPIRIIVSLTRLVGLVTRGSGQVIVYTIRDQSLDLSLPGAEDVTARSGRVVRQTMERSGSGDYVADTLHSDDARVRLLGSGNARVRVSGQLRTDVNGSGSLHAAGSPWIDAQTWGAGSAMRITSPSERN